MKLTERQLFEKGIKPENAIIPLDNHTIEFPYMHFDQDVIIRHYSPIRFDKRYRNPSIIAQTDFVPRYNLYHISDFKKQYGNQDKPDYYLIIDEKERDFEQLVLGGIMITPDESEYIIDFINKYKLYIIPNLNPQNWFVKGDNKHERRFKKDAIKFNKEDNNRRWRAFGEMLEYLRVNYTFHFSIIDNIKEKVNFQNTRKDKTKVRNESTKEAFKNLLLSIDMFKYNNLKIITDDINAGTEKIYRKVIKEFCPNGVNVTLEIVKKQDMHKNKGILLQYVDINLYAIYRFVFPNMYEGKFNILANFELFAYKDFKKLYSNQMTKSEIDNIEEISKVFESIKNVYQNIKLHTLQNIYIKDELKGDNVPPNSSIIYKDKEQNNNFAKNFLIGVNKFCTVRTNETFSNKERPINFKETCRDLR
jgi:hypothetical protein